LIRTPTPARSLQPDPLPLEGQSFGEHSDNLLSSIDAYETRLDIQVRSLMETIGTYGLGADLTSVAWPKLQQVFTGADSDILKHLDRPPCLILNDIHRAPKAYLRRHPVNLLILGNLDIKDHDAWMARIPSDDSLKPKIVAEFWEPWHITRNEDGPMSKLNVTRWSHLGFRSSCTTANAIQTGGVVDRKWLSVVRERLSGWVWPELLTKVRRPMANCLRHVGVPSFAYRHIPQDSSRLLPHADRDCMPAKVRRSGPREAHDVYCTMNWPTVWGYQSNGSKNILPEL
jgi:hypothetical protein